MLDAKDREIAYHNTSVLINKAKYAMELGELGVANGYLETAIEIANEVTKSLKEEIERRKCEQVL